MKLITFSSAIIISVCFSGILAKDCGKKSNSKLFCYYGKIEDVDSCKCTHIVVPPDSDGKSIEKLRQNLKGTKILITVNEFNQDVVDLLKSSKVDGIELNLKKLDSKNDLADFISTVKSKLGNDLFVAVSVPSSAETLAKYYDFKTLSKSADLFILQTAFLGANKNVTFHPSRLSGLWDMQNTDSVVDLVSGLGAPLSKLVITSPVQAFKFKLQSEKHTAPGSPALAIESLNRDEFCKMMKNGRNWTLERDQDQSGPYIFSEDLWIAFEDSMSIDIKAKYSRVRGLAGLALKDLSQDGGSKCESSLLEAAFNGLSRQARAPRGAVLHSLEREILETHKRPLDSIQVSPYRISRVIDVEGNVHVVRQDTRTEFECSRQGYFVHPRSCNRFYRCVKFNQLTDEFSVFEFDCPAGLAFDERVEVCVWPGSLPHASACAGSSEIAPVPRQRFICPGEEGYYADPENCRWFFACLDHGKSPLSAYEFRCPFGLVFDQERLLCEWPWLVPKCGNGYAVGSQVVYGGSGGAGSALALEQYDGFGRLGSISLGGLHGPIQPAIAKTYTNVGSTASNMGLAGIDLNSHQGNYANVGTGLLRQGYSTGNSLASNNNGYYGQGQYVTTSGLSANAAQSLVDAGLLKTSGNLVSVGGSGYNSGNYAQYASTANGYGSKLVGQGLVSLGGRGYDSGTYTQYASTANGYGSKQSGQSLLLQNQHQYNSDINAINNLQQQYTYNAENQQNYGSGAGSVYVNDLKTSGQVGISGLGSIIGSAHSVNGLAYDNNVQGISTGGGGAKSEQSFVQYHGQAQSQANYESSGKSSLEFTSGSGVAGNINIIGGGYSAVGVADSGIEITNNGAGSASFDTVTPSPISVTTISSIPTVTSVPVPGIKVASGFESFKGGVVANLPELQYKVQKPDAGNVYYQSSEGVSAAKSNANTFINIVSSTPATTLISGGYDYPKPSISFNEEPVKTTVYQHQQPVIVSSTSSPQVLVQNVQQIREGYSYPKPAIRFEETTVTVQKAGAGGSFSYQNLDIVHANQGYVHDNPSVQVQVPLKAVNQEAVSSFSYSTGTSTIKPLTVVQQVQPVLKQVVQPVQPALSVQKHEFQGYDYPRPAVAYEEGPQIRVQPVQKVIQPVVQVQPVLKVQSTVQPAISVSTFQKNEFQGYDYPKPAVSFEEIPQIRVQQPIVKVQPVVQKIVQPAVQVQPVLKVQSTAQPAVSVSTFQKHEFQGYDYPKPAVAFEETPKVLVNSYLPSSTLRPLTVVQPQVYVSSTVAPIVQQQKVVQPAVVSTFSISSHQQQQLPIATVGYQYPKPSIAFEERPIQKTVVATQPVSTYTFQNVLKEAVGYTYPKPAIAFEETPASTVRIHQQPAVVSSYSYTAPSTVRPAVVKQVYQPVVHQQVVQPVVSTYRPPVIQESVGYDYPKPAIAFEERPIVKVQKQPAVVSSYSYTSPSTVRPAVVQQQVVQPVISTYRPPIIQESVGYAYPKPAIAFEETPVVVKQPAVVSSYSYTAPSTVRPAVVKQVYQPVVHQQVVHPVVSTYRPPVLQESVGYDYPKPAIAFEERPIVKVQKQPAVVSSFSYTAPSTVRPAVVKQVYQPVIQQEVIQPVVSTYRPTVVQESVGYDYPKPSITFEERPIVKVQKQPAVVSSYSYTAPATIKPVIKQVYQPVVQQVQPVVSSYNYVSSTTPATAVVSTFEYRAPSTVTTPVIVQKQLPVATYSYTAPSSTVKPAVTLVEQPRPFITYENRQPVQEEVLVAKKAYVTGGQSTQYNQQSYSNDGGYVYDRPAIAFEENKPLVVENYRASVVKSTAQPIIDYNYVQSTPRPTLATVVQKVVTAKLQPKDDFYYYDSRLSSTPPSEPIIIPEVEKTITKVSRPIAKYSFSSLDSVQTPLVSTTIEDYVAPIIATTLRPAIRYTTEVPYITKPSRDYLPVRSKVRVTTESPVFVVPEVTKPSRDYLPVRSRVRVTTAKPIVKVPTRAYLPVGDDEDGSDDIVVTSRRPVKIVKVVRPKTIVKQNDFHPVLAAKLGAQCTCASSTLRLRKNKKPLRIIVESEDDDDDDGYTVEGDGGNVVESYEYEPQRIVDITPTPQVVFSSTTEDLEPISVVPVVRKRVRVRPVTRTLTPIEVFVKKPSQSRVVVDSVDDDGPSDREIAKAVRTGLKLVKQAAKEGAREGASEALSGKSFDRYGPGGWRSRDETLQGTIDCQRAGLFRHPTQCNKFYACRWDCTKKRFTLHVFNCPVHLTFDNNLGACNWPSQGPACLENTLLPSE